MMRTFRPSRLSPTLPFALTALAALVACGSEPPEADDESASLALETEGDIQLVNTWGQSLNAIGLAIATKIDIKANHTFTGVFHHEVVGVSRTCRAGAGRDCEIEASGTWSTSESTVAGKREKSVTLSFERVDGQPSAKRETFKWVGAKQRQSLKLSQGERTEQLMGPAFCGARHCTCGVEICTSNESCVTTDSLAQVCATSEGCSLLTMSTCRRDRQGNPIPIGLGGGGG